MFNPLASVLHQPSLEDGASGLTVPDLLLTSCHQYPNQTRFFQYRRNEWQAYTNEDLNHQSCAAAVGLIKIGLSTGDRVGLLLKSGVDFLIADLACATANLVTVPIDLSQTIENIIFCLRSSGAKVLIIQNYSLLSQISAYLYSLEKLERVIIYELEGRSTDINSSSPQATSTAAYPSIPASVGLDLNQHLQLDSHKSWPAEKVHSSWPEVLNAGQRGLSEVPNQIAELDKLRFPQDLATIIYTPDEHGTLLGVMLSHHNLTSTALASFAGMTGLRKGDRESAVTFLPLTHIFARMMLYGHLYYGHRVYFSTPRRVMKHLQEVRPTILTTVPLLLHRIYRRLKCYGHESSMAKMQPKRSGLLMDVTRLKQTTQGWAMAIASQQPDTLRDRIQQVSARFIFSHWRKIFGGRIRFCLCGGAALDATVATFFVSIGFPLYQGYGLTQTSSTVTFNRPEHNIPGTVGTAREGVKCAIAQDGEILVKGNGNFMGYFNASRHDVDAQGWFHTGDLGHLDARGNLTILGSKKSLFKLTTGKYVTPVPLEEMLTNSTLVRYALVVGAEQKFCAALLFVDPQALQHRVKKMGLMHYGIDALLENPCVQALFQSLVDGANCHFPYWSTIKKIRLLSANHYPASLREYAPASIRHRLVQRYAHLIEEIYQDSSQKRALNPAIPRECRDIPLVACPVMARSLNTRAS